MAEHADITLTMLATDLGKALKSRGWMLSLAESCTGGLVAQTITSVAGSSAWFDRAFVTYSNSAKTEMLGVSDACLQNYGAVSEQTAEAMAVGALNSSHAQIAGSITGIAGPDGGTPEKPVGTVCFAWASKDKQTLSFTAFTSTQHFHGDREQIRQQAAIFLMTRLVEDISQINQ